MVVQLRQRPAADQVEGRSGAPQKAVPATVIRIGLTASRKVGGAVIRNRARRRLREAMRSLLAAPDLAPALAGHDIVLIARGETADRPWPQLLEDLRRALRRLIAERGGGGRRGPAAVSHGTQPTVPAALSPSSLRLPAASESEPHA